MTFLESGAGTLSSLFPLLTLMLCLLCSVPEGNSAAEHRLVRVVFSHTGKRGGNMEQAFLPSLGGGEEGSHFLIHNCTQRTSGGCLRETETCQSTFGGFAIVYYILFCKSDILMTKAILESLGIHGNI